MENLAQMSRRASNVARMCLEMAAEAEKAKDRRQANDWRAKSAECFRIAAGHSVESQSLGANVIQLFK